MSEDGRYVTFYSSASNLVADGQDTNFRGDVFVYDRWNATTKKIVSDLIGDICSTFGDTRSLPCQIELMAVLGFEVTMCQLVNGQRMCFTVALSGEYQEPIEHYLRRKFSDLGKLGRGRKDPFLGGRCGWKCRSIIAATIGGGIYGVTQSADE